MKSLRVKSELAELEKVRSFLKQNLKGFHLSEEEFFKIELSLVEICTNIILYAYTQQEGEILLKTWHKDKKIFLEIRDTGIPFDPTHVEKPRIKAILDKEKRGGLGIYLARKLMDGFQYRREDNQNILLMFKEIKKAETWT